MEQGWDKASKLAILATLVSAALGIVWYFVALEGRIGRIESRLQAITISAASSSPEPQQNLSKSGASATTPPQANSDYSQRIINPLIQTCADLAKKAGERPFVSASDPITDAMVRLGCSDIGRSK